MDNSEQEKETFGNNDRRFLSIIQARITSLERELDDLRRTFAGYVLDMGPENVREFEGDEFRMVRDAIMRTLALSHEPLTYGQVHDQFEQHTKVYGVTRKELRRVLGKMSQGKRSLVRRFRKSSSSRVLLYELRKPVKGIWHQGRYWTAAELFRDPLLNKYQLSERTIRDRMKSAEFIHQIVDRPATTRGRGARTGDSKIERLP